MKIGDIVVRKSYSRDIKFKIVNVKFKDGNKRFILKGESIRIIADAFEDDLEIIEDYVEDNLSRFVKQKIKQASENKKKYKNICSDYTHIQNNNYGERRVRAIGKVLKKKGSSFGRSGSVLHVDGDFEYLSKCISVYEQLFVNVYGECVEEYRQPDIILDLVRFYNPDIVVLTGHDSMSKNINDYMDLNLYKNSRYFLESVKKLRNYERDLDSLVIFAGACQSCYELLIEAGANFATSPRRVLVHCLDPVFVCSKIFNTSIDETLKIDEILSETITGFNGVGGVQTRGKYREGFPKSFYI